jgi:hypothetical protein
MKAISHLFYLKNQAKQGKKLDFINILPVFCQKYGVFASLKIQVFLVKIN